MRRFTLQHLIAISLFALSLIVMIYTGFSAYSPLAAPGEAATSETGLRQSDDTSSTTKAPDGRNNQREKIGDFVYTSVYKSTVENKDEPVDSAHPVSQNIDQASQNKAAESSIFVPITLIVPGHSYELSVPPEVTVLALLEAAQMKTDFRFEARDYGRTLGKLVTEINGLREDRRTGHYWIYYVNGKWATEGISHYILNAHDIIEWKYEQPSL